MFNQNFKGTIRRVYFKTKQELKPIQAREYALRRLQNEGYKGCFIEEVYVNEKCVLKNKRI